MLAESRAQERGNREKTRRPEHGLNSITGLKERALGGSSQIWGSAITNCAQGYGHFCIHRLKPVSPSTAQKQSSTGFSLWLESQHFVHLAGEGFRFGRARVSAAPIRSLWGKRPAGPGGPARLWGAAPLLAARRLSAGTGCYRHQPVFVKTTLILRRSTTPGLFPRPDGRRLELRPKRKKEVANEM